MKEDNFEFNEDNWKKLKLSSNYDDSLENNFNDNNIINENNIINNNNQNQFLFNQNNNLAFQQFLSNFSNFNNNNNFQNNNYNNNNFINNNDNNNNIIIPMNNSQDNNFNKNNNFFNNTNFIFNNPNNTNNMLNPNLNTNNNQIYQNDNNNNNNNNNTNEPTKFILDKSLPTIGLVNIGATCYINATLQCLAHCIELSEDLLTWYLYSQDKDKESRNISYSYSNVLYNLFFPLENETYFSPNDFREIIASFGPLFEENQANDSKDIFQFIIENIHEELNELNNNDIIYDDDAQVNQADEIAVLNNFELMCKKKYHSPITKYLYGKQKSMTRCLNCGCTIYNFQVYSFIIFPLLDVKNFTLTYPNQNPNQILNLYDCFNYFQKIELFSGENHIYCMGCKQESNANFCNLIYSTPTILTLILNRGKNNADFHDKFLFPTVLNLDNYTNDKTLNNKFYLIGVVCHVGESGNSGHFFAYCRSHYQSPWFKYNDAIVSEIDETEIFRATTPYILFYHKYI